MHDTAGKQEQLSDYRRSFALEYMQVKLSESGQSSRIFPGALDAVPTLCSRLLGRCLPHFRAVHRGVLYRSGQPRGLGLDLVRLGGIRTLVNLRSPESSGSPAEAAFAARRGLRFYNLHMGIRKNRIAESAAAFLRIMDDPENLPVLVHCSRGKERSGVMAAVYRIARQEWSNQRALQEMHRLGVAPGSIPVAEDFVRSCDWGVQAVSGDSAVVEPIGLEVAWQE